jgi:antitoxin component YwqK of YwqJK toxin-antitoxin module
MNLLKFLVFFLLIIPINSFSQLPDTLNRTDKNGFKQGLWIKKYPDGHIQYNGYFKDNHPVGTFKRFYESDTLQSVMIFSEDGSESISTLYHTNGYIASAGKFVNKLKEGRWKFYSATRKGYLVSEEDYRKNIREGVSSKYYPDNKPSERLVYVNDVKHGEWTQYFPSGNMCLKAYFSNGKLDGGFFTYYDDGKPEYIGQYKNDLRSGTWKIYNSNGTLKYNLEYSDGIAKNSELDKKEAEYLDAIEKNKGKIADPEKTGTIWQLP